MPLAPNIVWFRNDLRVHDHRALTAALAAGGPAVLLYVLDDTTPDQWRMGGASRWWLDKSLRALAADIATRGNRLILRRGRAEDALADVVAETGARGIYFSRAYEPWAVAQEQSVQARFVAQGLEVKRYGGTLLREPEAVRTKGGEPFKVYTPFWRALSDGFAPGKILPAPARLPPPAKLPASDRLEQWDLHPSKPDWSKGFAPLWTPGAAGARARLRDFMREAVRGYATDRDRPDRPGTSRLSPHLHFGEITPAECWHAATAASEQAAGRDRGVEVFLKELAWREFSYALLTAFPTLPEQPFRAAFAAMPWRKDAAQLSAWQRGVTGYPIVDAGMRELWATGYMHNRVRMITASFLTKHLLLPWQQGAAWFWDTLVDADLASNSASWQWVAGSGADAAPYFRIFNPVLQGEKFDPEGNYVRRWVPELSALDASVIHAPWRASSAQLAAAGVTLGRQYPHPIVDHSAARERALSAYGFVKGADN